MKYVRTNVYAKGGDFSDPTILWYARGVGVLKARQITDPTSWRFYAAIHGIDTPLWEQYGYLSPSDPLPPQADIDLYWNQCQHGSWYFLPWHRGYLLAFEAAVRAAVVSLGGPEDWALPYWNYFAPDENALPPAFGMPDLPDGEGPNPLYVAQRWGPTNSGKVYVPLSQVNLRALTDPDFTGVASGGSPGFGGVDTGFSHGGRPHGRLEHQPHDAVHVLVGGSDPADPNLPGLMSDPDTAGLDPIFWLHHANIDRLWESWLQGPVSLGNPTDPKWVNGPASVGQRPFVMPWPPTGTQWTYTPGDMANLADLDYVYDNLAPAGVSPTPAVALEAPPAPVKKRAAAMAPTRHNVEMVGASEQPVRITGRDEARTSVRLDAPMRRKMTARLDSVAAEAGAAALMSPGERVFLNLENVRGTSDGTVLEVYLNVPAGTNPAHRQDRRVGSVGLFGLRKASAPDGEHGGEGLTFVLEITEAIHALHLESALAANELEVRIVPFNQVPEESPVSIGRVSVFRHGR